MNHSHESSGTARIRRCTLSAFFIGALFGSLSAFSTAFADDTEVFFGQIDGDTNVYPNVMFVLDTSGSMNYTDDGYSGSRLERMKSALNTILDSSANVNIGLMRFNGSNGGGAVLHPVTGINKQVCANSDCGTISLTKQVQSEDDVIEQYLSSIEIQPIASQLRLGSPVLIPQVVSIRFQDLNIPSGAQITSAELEFTADTNKYLPTGLTISGHDIGDSASIGSTPINLATRPRTEAEVSWQPSSWVADNEYQSPGIQSVVQEIVNRSDWCGGQSMAFFIEGSGERSAYAYTSDNANKAPVLRVTYDSTTIPVNQGCITNTVLSQIDNSTDDAYEKTSDNSIVTAGSLQIPLTIGNGKKVKIIKKRKKNNNNGNGKDKDKDKDKKDENSITPVVTRLRFKNLSIPTGATIESATIEFEVDEQQLGNLAVTFQAVDIDSAPDLTADNGWISNRTPLVADPVEWTIDNLDIWPSNSKVTTPNLASQVQKIVNRSGWQANNHIAFIIKQSETGSNYRQFESYDTDKPAAPKLRVVYRSNVKNNDQQGIAFKTARDDMKSLINDLSATGGTPIVDAYYEAVRYMLGGPVDYGTQRGSDDSRHRFHRVSHPTSYTGGSVSVDSACTSSNPQSDDCKYEKIIGSPVYISPLADSCQTNHIVFLSDGAATSNSAIGKVKNLIGADSCDPSSGNEACGVELATWLNETDHNQNISRDQNISTYTIGFNINSNFLSNLATAGGGTYYDAASSEELVAVFHNILGDVLSVDTSFVAPGATVNQFNRLTHRNDVYFALFKPSARATWAGNLKRYYVGADSNGSVLIQDENTNAAVDEDSGFFLETASSWWSDTADGGAVELGGAANQVSLDGPDGVGDRRVFTYLEDGIPDSGVDLTASAQRLHELNTRISTNDLGLGDASILENATRRIELLRWARGVDVKDEDLDNDETDVRRHMGDPMHTPPVLLNYMETGSHKSTIFMATNEGLLHAIEHDNGTELFAFMPKELLPNINDFYENQQSTKHPYGLDGDLTLWHDDTNNNVMVDSGETARLFLGMRRGGNHYYAFDVSDRLNPKLLWQVDGGSGDFEQLGQTWSKPTSTTISYNGQSKRVVIFAGGYDTNQDPNTSNLTASQAADSIGNAIYIVDADTGEKLWSGQGEIGGDAYFADMDYSIPADIRIIDVDGDALADQMYVGDMGGQLWRFDFEPYHQSGQLVYGGVMAKLNGGSASEARRLYNEPDVALVASKGQNFLSVSFGSGWRAHPLNERVEDRFYMIRSNNVYSRPESYGKNTGSEISPIWEPLTEDDLVNVTDDVDPVLNDKGWLLELEGSGEKVIGKSVTINNQVVFTSYEPTASGDACSPAIGGGSAYVVDVVSGAPTLNLDGSDGSDTGTDDSDETDDTDDSNTRTSYNNNTLTKEDRKVGLQQDGIPPSPTALITETDGNIGTTVLVGTETVDVDFDNLTQRTYWQDNGRGRLSPDEVTAEVAD